MNFARLFLLLSSLALIICSCSNIDSSELKISVPTPGNFFRRLPDDMKRYIETYYPFRPLLWRHIDIETFQRFTLKELVQMTFNIPELENVADNEPELAGLLRLSWIKGDHNLLFEALMEEVVFGKKPYKVIFRPLILYLVRLFRAINEITRQMYKSYFFGKVKMSVEEFLAKICIKHGYYDFLFDLFETETLFNFRSSLFLDIYANCEYREIFFYFFIVNPEYLSKYLSLLFLTKNKLGRYSEGHIGLWISKCIIYDLPQSYYAELFDNDPEVLEYMITNFLNSTDIPESENERIYNQVSDLLTTYSGNLANSSKFKYLRMMNDIRFGAFDLDEIGAIHFNLLDEETVVKLGKAALLANKRDLFSFIYENSIKYFRAPILDEILTFEQLNINTDAQAKNFKMIFELIQVNPFIFRNEVNLYKFAMKFYSIQGMTYDDVSMEFTSKFSISENLLDYGFPPVIIIRVRKEKNYDNVWNILYGDLFTNINVLDENTIIPLIHDFVAYRTTLPTSIKLNVHKTSFDVLELISRLPELLKFMIENKVQLCFSFTPEMDEKYLNLKNFDLINRIIRLRYNLTFMNLDFSDLKKQEHIARFEIITGLSVVDIFLKWQESSGAKQKFSQGQARVLYFNWRPVLAYWIKGPHRGSIILIRNSKFIEMLKLDFPNETAYLF